MISAAFQWFQYIWLLRPLLVVVCLIQGLIFNQSQSSCKQETKLRNNATSPFLPNQPTVKHAKTDDGYARDHQRAWQVEKSVRDVNKKMSEAGVKPRNSNSEVKELYFCGSTMQTARNVTLLIYFSTRIPMVSISKQNF